LRRLRSGTLIELFDFAAGHYLTGGKAGALSRRRSFYETSDGHDLQSGAALLINHAFVDPLAMDQQYSKIEYARLLQTDQNRCDRRPGHGEQ
jgi:hypothetical protein